MIAIDPGVNACGVAVFDVAADYLRYTPTRPTPSELVLKRASYLSPTRRDLGLWFTEHAATLVRIEFPRIYPAASQKGDQNDLMQLARVCGRLEAWAQDAGHTVEFVEPRQWKGTLDPDVMTQRIIGRVTEDERRRVQLPSAKSLQHNVWDAVGIGLHALGRLEPRKVFPR